MRPAIRAATPGIGRAKDLPAPRDARATDLPAVPRIPDSAARRVIGQYLGEDRLTGELQDCVGRLLRIASAEPFLATPELIELAAGGKRLRPLFVLAAAYSADRDLPAMPAARAVRAAVVVELLHLASLVHDDVMDEAAVRHGVTTVNSREGNIRAVLVGDYLLAQSLAAAGSLGRSEASIAARAFVRLCEGQAQESADLFDANRTEAAYFRAAAAKTGALFEASCRIGAVSGGLGLKPAAALAEYGMSLGIAFQLLDDVLDFTATEHQLGKPSGHDVVEGVYTLPLLRALRGRPGFARTLADLDRQAAAEARRYAVRAVDALAGAAPFITTGAADMLAALAGALVPESGQLPLSAPRRARAA